MLYNPRLTVKLGKMNTSNCLMKFTNLDPPLAEPPFTTNNWMKVSIGSMNARKHKNPVKDTNPIMSVLNLNDQM